MYSSAGSCPLSNATDPLFLSSGRSGGEAGADEAPTSLLSLPDASVVGDRCTVGLSSIGDSEQSSLEVRRCCREAGADEAPTS